jgi:hypothetical protein
MAESFAAVETAGASSPIVVETDGSIVLVVEQRETIVAWPQCGELNRR